MELHPYFQQKELQEFCAAEGIVLTAYSPLANPAMPFHKEGDPNVLHDTVLSRIAQKHGKVRAGSTKLRKLAFFRQTLKWLFAVPFRRVSW